MVINCLRLYNKQNITRRFEDINFILYMVKTIFYSFTACVNCFHHSKIKFISSHRRVISSIHINFRTKDLWLHLKRQILLIRLLGKILYFCMVLIAVPSLAAFVQYIFGCLREKVKIYQNLSSYSYVPCFNSVVEFCLMRCQR